ncbi:MAG: L-ribulose-5-phosphate 3-epimerase [Eubacteriales bacterium]|nr:L-ribulose-5-phosphate 3-epimerase [Eubacteriales bacterium]
MNRKRSYSLGLYEKALPDNTSFREKLEAASSCGFDRLEISIDESDLRLERLDWSADAQRELRRMSDDIGVPISTMCLSGHRKYPFGSHEESVREKSLDIMKKAVDFSCEAGVKIIQLAGYDVYYEDHDDFTEAMFSENLRKAVDYASGSGIVLAFETMETPFMDTVGKAMKYVDKIRSPWLGVYPDIGNLKNAAVLYGHDVIDDLRFGNGHLFAVHLKETKPGVYRNMHFGTGHTEYESCIQCAKESGVHMFTGEFWYLESTPDYLEEIRYSADFLRSKLDKIYC